MNWLQLRPESIANLAEFSLCLVLTLYLLSLRSKSRDGQLMSGIFVIYTVYLFTSVLDSSLAPSAWSPFIQWSHDGLLAFVMIYYIWFAYVYRHNPFRKEMPAVLIISGIATAVGLYFHHTGFPWTWTVFPFTCGWVTLLFARKARWASRLEREAVDTGSVPAAPDSGIAVPFTSRDAEAFRAFFLWSLLQLFIFLNANMALFTFNTALFPVLMVAHHTFVLIVLTWLAIIFMDYAEEATSFLAKLVGLFLCLTLIILGLMGFLLFGFDAQGATYALALRTLAGLIVMATLTIVIVFPIFFRRTLLRPLNYVLKGLQRVNEGDLRVEVPVQVHDEIGRLAQNFNWMTQTLKKSKDELAAYAETLEMKVAERTAQLEHKTTQLEISLEDLKSAQSQLIQKEKMASLGELTAGVAHEIQNPLNFVTNFSTVSAEMVEELKEERAKKDRDEELEADLLNDLGQNLQKICHHGKRADAIVKGMLEHSRTGTGVKQPTDLNNLAGEYLRLAYHGLQAKDTEFNAELLTNFDPNLTPVEVVPQDIGRVLQNLYNNAFYSVAEKRKMTLDGYQPQVSVSTRKVGDVVEVFVRDNGQGIPQRVLGKIYHPFFTTKPTGHGTGLGLSLSYDIVTKGHGGEIKVETEEGQFAEFSIRIPIKARLDNGN